MVNQMYPAMQSPYVQQPQQRGGFGQALANNSNLLTMLGLGLMSGRGPEAYQNAMLGAFQGSQLDKQKRERRDEKQKTANQLNATAQWLINSRGVDPMEVQQAQEGGFLGTLAAQHMKKPDMPAAYEQFILAQKDPAFGEFLDRRSPQTNINMPPQEKEYDKARGKQFAELAGSIDDAAMAAHGRIGMLDHMEQLLSNPAVYQGAGGEANLALRKAAGSLGFDMEGVSDAEAARAIGNRMALELRNPSGGAGMPGAMSDKDREFLTSSVPGLTKTREGNMKLIEYSKRVAQRDLEVQRLAQNYVQRNGRLDSGFSAELRAFSDANPLFPEANETGGGTNTNDPLGIR